MDPTQVLDVDNLNTQLLVNGAVLAAGAYLLSQLRSLPGRLWAFARRRCAVSVEVLQGRDCFNSVVNFVAEQPFLTRRRDLSLVRVTAPDGSVSYHFPPAPGLHFFWYRGRLASVQKTRRDLDSALGGPAQQEAIRLTFFLAGPETVRQFVLEAEAENAAGPDGAIRVLQFSRTRGWSVRWCRGRRLSTVFLADGLVESLADDVRTFFDGAAWYEARGIPHRRGYLLEGPPGNGKTSLVRALADELGLSVVAASLSMSGLDDSGLAEAFDDLPPRSLVLLEDVDCLFRGRESGDDDSGSRVTFSGLLNVLDGVYSQEGYVLVMTTNHPEVLDPALIRPGRVDRRVHVGHVAPEQAARYFRHFFPEADPALAEAFAARVPDGRLSMAQIQALLYEHRGDPARAAAAPLPDPVSGPALPPPSSPASADASNGVAAPPRPARGPFPRSVPPPVPSLRRW